MARPRNKINGNTILAAIAALGLRAWTAKIVELGHTSRESLLTYFGNEAHPLQGPFHCPDNMDKTRK